MPQPKNALNAPNWFKLRPENAVTAAQNYYRLSKKGRIQDTPTSECQYDLKLK
jgi:hypothetical protein